MSSISPESNLIRNPVIQLAGHILFGGAVSIGGFLGGSFLQGVATAISYTPLSTLPLGVIVAGIVFAGYAGYVILSWSETSNSPSSGP